MHEYEIRVLTVGRGDTVIELLHLNDHAAIRAAKKLANGKRFEVWRGLDCVYADATPTPTLSVVRPNADAT
jgi:hypothetical protein